MPSDIINFEVVDGLKIMIYTETSQYNLNCLNSLDYPNIDLSLNSEFISIKDTDMKKMIRQTIFAISTQESRPLLTGLNLKVNGNILEIVATDSYRVAKKTVTLEDNYQDMVNIVIPGKNMSELDKILNESEKNVEIHIFTNKVIFKYDNILFQSNLLNGSYPNTDSFIPTEFIHVITANLNDFYSSIDRAALLTQSKDKNIVKMELSGQEIRISSYASEIGKVEDKIIVKRNNDEDCAISFSAKFMMDALKTLESEEIIIFMNTDTKPIVIKSATDESLIQLILPIKTY
jgi:DNA polymerase-3 subunit beta